LKCVPWHPADVPAVSMSCGIGFSQSAPVAWPAGEGNVVADGLPLRVSTLRAVRLFASFTAPEYTADSPTSVGPGSAGRAGAIARKL
jgi:hypothetical protein